VFFTSSAIPRFPTIALPLIEDIPLVGRILSGHTLLVYVAYFTVPVVSWALYRTRWGLRIRIVGEAEDAAAAAGVDVDLIKIQAMLASGFFCGLAGAYLSLGYVSLFAKQVTNDRGLIAIAAIIFARGNPYATAMVFRVNVGGTIDAAEIARQIAARQGSCRLVLCSSLTVYGNQPQDGIVEDAPLLTRTCYASSKVAAEAVALSYAEEHGVDSIVLRIAGVYGPRRRTSCVLRLMIEDALAGRPTHLGYGKGFPRQWVHVDDVAEGIILALEAKDLKERIYNLSGGINPTIDVAAAIVRELIPGADIDLADGPDPEDVTLGLLDITAARADLGYAPRIDLPTGIKSLIAANLHSDL
jgi:UDP-glucuronate 4-epimerase